MHFACHNAPGAVILAFWRPDAPRRNTGAEDPFHNHGIEYRRGGLRSPFRPPTKPGNELPDMQLQQNFWGIATAVAKREPKPGSYVSISYCLILFRRDL
jgi:hypothetical protein